MLDKSSAFFNPTTKININNPKKTNIIGSCIALARSPEKLTI